MKKILKTLSTVLLMVILLSACKSSNVPKEMTNVVFNSTKGGQLLIAKETGKNPVLNFQGPSLIGPNTNPEDFKDEKSKIRLEKGEKLRQFSNLTIVEENGKKYLKADGLEYKLQVIDNKTIIDDEDSEKYVYIDLNK